MLVDLLEHLPRYIVIVQHGLCNSAGLQRHLHELELLDGLDLQAEAGEGLGYHLAQEGGGVVGGGREETCFVTIDEETGMVREGVATLSLRAHTLMTPWSFSVSRRPRSMAHLTGEYRRVQAEWSWPSPPVLCRTVESQDRVGVDQVLRGIICAREVAATVSPLLVVRCPVH